jgi:hypothetical protein
MEPISIGLVAGGLFLASRLFGKKKGSSVDVPPPEVISTGFEPFGPDHQAMAWYAATSLQWVFAGQLGDNAGRVAYTYRGKPGGSQAANDLAFRKAMSDGMRVVVSPSVMGGGGIPPYLLLVPDAFSAASVPSDWGPLRQMYAPPPGSFGTPPSGGLPNGTPSGPGYPGNPGDPLGEIPDPETKAQIRKLLTSDGVSLLDLDDTAKELDAAGYPAAAQAVRDRRKQVALQRTLEAKQRGGWLYVIRLNEALPFKLAQYYGGIRPKALKELQDANPKIATGGSWSGWIAGEEILLPGAWPDPSLKPLPPLTQGSAPKPSGSTGPIGPTGPNPPGKPKPGYYVDPITGKPLGRPGDEPWMAPPGASPDWGNVQLGEVAEQIEGGEWK